MGALIAFVYRVLMVVLLTLVSKTTVEPQISLMVAVGKKKAGPAKAMPVFTVKVDGEIVTENRVLAANA